MLLRAYNAECHVHLACKTLFHVTVLSEVYIRKCSSKRTTQIGMYTSPAKPSSKQLYSRGVHTKVLLRAYRADCHVHLAFKTLIHVTLLPRCTTQSAPQSVQGRLACVICNMLLAVFSQSKFPVLFVNRILPQSAAADWLSRSR